MPRLADRGVSVSEKSVFFFLCTSARLDGLRRRHGRNIKFRTGLAQMFHHCPAINRLTISPPGACRRIRVLVYLLTVV